jgi:hypothetical protein
VGTDAKTLRDVPLDLPVNGKAQTYQLPALVLDGVNPQRAVAYEFVSQADTKAWEKEITPAGASLWGPESAAALLQRGLVKAKPAGTYALFYDPEYPTAAGAKEQLGKQVRDFVAWLKAQGVI